MDTITPNWGSSQPFTYTFDAANRLTDFERPNPSTHSGQGGVNSHLDYDAAGRPITLTHQTITQTLASYRHTLDRVSNRLAVTETLLALVEVSAGTYVERGGQVVMEAEHFSQRSGSAGHDWLLKTSQSGYSGTSYRTSQN